MTRLCDLAYRATNGDVRALGTALAFLRDGPSGRGIAWANGLEVASRLVSLVRIGTVTTEPAVRMAVQRHAQFLLDHGTPSASANNHRVGELAALALAGRVLADTPIGLRAARTAQAELPEVLSRQVHEDGSGVEQSTHYLAYTLEWALLARACGVTGLSLTMARASTFLMHLLDAGGNAPGIGDDDGGHVLMSHAAPERCYVASITGNVRATLELPVPPGWVPDLRSVAYGAKAPQCVAIATSAHFPGGGLTVLRHNKRVVVFDHGPLGGPPLAAHGHADALSVWISDGSTPVVVGRGTGRYNAAPEVRRFHRGVHAHPAIVVDGRGASVPSDHPFLWKIQSCPKLISVDLVGNEVTAALTAHGIRIVRRVWLGANHMEVTDKVEGHGQHVVQLTWPLAPGISLLRHGAQIVLRMGDSEVARVTASSRVDLVFGGPFPGIGWHAVGYGRWVPAAALRCVAHVRLPFTHTTRFDFTATGSG